MYQNMEVALCCGMTFKIGWLSPTELVAQTHRNNHPYLERLRITISEDHWFYFFDLDCALKTMSRFDT